MFYLGFVFLDLSMEQAYLCWSGGKDATLALYRSICSDLYDVKALFSVVKKDSGKLAMHEMGEHLLRKQAEAVGIPFIPFHIDTSWTDNDYEANMSQVVESLKSLGLTTAMFGDLYLEELRRQRETKCFADGIKAVFPLWHIPTKDVVSEFVKLGFKAVVTCVDCSVLSESFVGRIIDNDFIADFPSGADVCGENGEYHSFVFNGPIFSHPVDFNIKGEYSREYVCEEGGHTARYCYLNLE